MRVTSNADASRQLQKQERTKNLGGQIPCAICNGQRAKDTHNDPVHAEQVFLTAELRCNEALPGRCLLFCFTCLWAVVLEELHK